MTVVAVYVDNLILITTMDEDMTKLEKSVESKFKMKDMGRFHYCLGISTIQDKEKGCLWIHQKQHISHMLEKYNLMDANPVTTPADPNVKLVKNDEVSKRVNSMNSQLWAVYSMLHWQHVLILYKKSVQYPSSKLN